MRETSLIKANARVSGLEISGLSLTTTNYVVRKAEEMNRACWGYYRSPDERDIQKVRRIHSMKVKDESFNQSPFEVLTPETLEASAKSAFEATEKRKEQVSKETDARMDDFFRLHLDGFADGKPKPFVYLKQTEGGIYLP
jgi:hypothetical protein